MKVRELKREIKGVFKQPVKEYYFGKLAFGTPYFWPLYFVDTIINIRRLKLKSDIKYKEYTQQFPHLKNTDRAKFSNLPMVRRSKDWIIKIFNNYYWITIGWPFKLHRGRLGWKDKYDSPRFEWAPSFIIFFFKWQFCIWWVGPSENTDEYYEQILWYLYYANKDIDLARDTWGWRNREGESTWNDKYLKEYV